MSSCGSPASTTLPWLTSHRPVKTSTSVQHGNVLCISSSAVTVVRKHGIFVLRYWPEIHGTPEAVGLYSYHAPYPTCRYDRPRTMPLGISSSTWRSYHAGTLQATQQNWPGANGFRPPLHAVVLLAAARYAFMDS